MRNQDDQLQMRQMFVEGDLVSAEVQNASTQEGAAALHTRSLKYGKLQHGLLIEVPCRLIQRLPQHYLTIYLPKNKENSSVSVNPPASLSSVDVILGLNGFVWITRTPLLSLFAFSPSVAV